MQIRGDFGASPSTAKESGAFYIRFFPQAISDQIDLFLLPTMLALRNGTGYCPSRLVSKYHILCDKMNSAAVKSLER